MKLKKKKFNKKKKKRYKRYKNALQRQWGAHQKKGLGQGRGWFGEKKIKEGMSGESKYVKKKRKKFGK